MERKTKHRILGILVVIGLVIILLPLFQHERESSTEPSLVQPPPFPDQSGQTPVAPEPESQMPSTQEQGMSAPQSLPIQDPSQQSGINAQPDDTVSPDSAAQRPIENATPSAPITTPDTAPVPAPAIPDTSAVESSNPATSVATMQPDGLEGKTAEAEQVLMTPAEPPAITPEQSTIKPTATHKAAKKSAHKTMAHAKKRATPSSQSPLEDDGLLKLKNSVWVIQMGSFKNKTNAVRLVNKLRDKGYPAFIQQVASSTRVFVGPSTKQHSARNLASKIKTDMQMEGIVISYKPLSL